MRLTQRQRRVTKRGRFYAQSQSVARASVRHTGRREFMPAQKRTAVAILALVTAAIALFSSSPAFFVYADETQYLGLHLLSPQSVWNGTKIPDGLSVFFLNPSNAAAALEQLPEVKTASVTLRIPNHLRIAVTERLPQIAWTQAGVTWWVDDTGKVLAMVNPADVPPTSPAIASLDSEPLRAGMSVDPIAIRSILQYNALAPQAARFQYARDRGISVITPQGWPIHLGDDSSITAKISRMKAFLADFEQRGIVPVYLDLRAPEAPAYKR